MIVRKKEQTPITWEKTVKHFKTITHHKKEVAKGCFAVGLYRQGICHDLSTYSWTEFQTGARYFQGDRSPNNAEREAIGYSSAWLHHKGRNRHHYEYWLDYSARTDSGYGKTGIVPAKMPGRYVIEMVMDRIAACKTYLGDAYTDDAPLAYYSKGQTWKFLHPETRRLLEKLLHMLADEGEEATFAYIRAHLYQVREGHKYYPYRDC